LAISYFVIWPFTGFSSPASVVRVMACRDTNTIRRSIALLSVYNLWIYLPLIVICICARSLMPALDKSDEVIPRMALLTTSKLPGGSLIAGLILAAPFGAVLATVSCYLVVIASGLVRDIYQRFLRPNATGREMRWLSYVIMVSVGAIALVANIRPVQYLQAIVVFSGTGAAATLFAPLMMAAYWRRATVAGVMCAMFSGSGTTLSLYILGWFGSDPGIGQMTQFRPYYLLGCEPIIWAIPLSCLVGIVVSLLTSPPPADHVGRLFDAAVATQPENSSRQA
jgi:SSS family solute:Na+ symporter/sodium/pantothenate symporter